MSRLRDVLPPAVAVGLGVFNGIYVFAPALKEQEEGLTGVVKPLDGAPGLKTEPTRIEDANNSKAASTLVPTTAMEAVIEPAKGTSSWLPSLKLWSKPENAQKALTPVAVASEAQNKSTSR